jgi:DivIVA domain-containing protein
MAEPAGTDLHQPLTAAELQAVTFHETRFRTAGYDEDEVDDFIDRVAGAVQAMHDRMTELEAENTRLREQRDLIIEQPQERTPSAEAVAAQQADLEQHIAYLTQLRNTTKVEVRAFIQSLIDHLDRIEVSDPVGEASPHQGG